MQAGRTRILIATTNPGKLREFQGAARSGDISVDALPRLRTITPPVEGGATFEDNARIKAEYYSRHAPRELVLAEDSGLMVDALGGAPGVHSARYAALLRDGALAHTNSSEDENNRALVMQLERLGSGPFAGKYVCVIAAAKDGALLQTFRGEAHGEILMVPRGNQGFGYDPFFLFPALGKTFAELTLDEKSALSHRGKAFREFLGWYGREFPL
jgi:XTP/dITP diphosphohydrolase